RLRLLADRWLGHEILFRQGIARIPAAFAVIVPIEFEPLEEASHLRDGVGMEVDPQINLRIILPVYNAQPGGTLGSVDAVGRLSTGLASALQRAHQAVFEWCIGIGQKALYDSGHRSRAGKSIAECRIIGTDC